MAGVLSFATPATLFASGVSVMQGIMETDLLELMAWFLLLGLELWGLLLVIGYLLLRIEPKSRFLRSATLVGAAGAAALAEFSNGRGHILIEQGAAQSIQSMHLNAFVFAFIMALLFFAHLHRSRAQEEAAARLADAKAAQHEARRRLGQARLQAVQARIDPQLLFEMLDTVRSAYDDDASRAERLLDDLASFLRAALPRLRSSSSSVQREVQLARAYARLRTLAGATHIDVTFDVPGDVAYARFPPGVLLPLLDDSLRRRAGPCEVIARRSSNDCRLVMMLPAHPRDPAVARVRSLLTDLYGSAAELAVDNTNDVASATVTVPYERA